ncbi:ATP-dependent protease ATPase subunit HslU [Aquariibacter albus]|uniref:ATP-dependent protease ATPase subunit HslU n=1 Tax=Aquariibacter albus TaxID=2759899 RepID=A0A839HNN4_9BURK|nr:ATP-dependent protease ATPase subunit HslU [Aquariibacter albus]MBB1163082.1 ATP-dependent protease ATPase subunit HslU [Aquariibacter albus]
MSTPLAPTPAAGPADGLRDLSPAQIVAELDRHIVGQHEAKRAVAIALRNRWRRARVEPGLRAEITPKNILMIGPTGVGKTEIARRLARLADAPFIKVEATKFTEVGYVGKDVDTIIRDLVEVAVKQAREAAVAAQRAKAEDAAEERLLDVLVPPPRSAAVRSGPFGFAGEAEAPAAPAAENTARQVMRKRLREGRLDATVIEIELAEARPGVEIAALPGMPGMDEMAEQLKGLFAGLGAGKRATRKLPIAEARRLLLDEEAAKLVNEDETRALALQRAEQHGIVFIDEIDKVASRGGSNGQAEVSRQGVQRDLLPLVEGTTVSTKYGMVRTDHMLFIASGAFHLSRPSDLIPELQGRFPIRVELGALGVAEFEAILTGTEASLTRQVTALLATEGVTLQFTPEGVQRLAAIACEVNERTENIGARRLATVMERLLDELSFDAPARAGQTVVIDAAYVDQRLATLARNEDLSRFIL